MAGETLIWHPEQPSNEGIADHFGVPEVAIIELRNAMRPFATEYRRPFDVFRFFKDRQEVVFYEGEYRWKINGIGFNASDVGGNCGKISILFGRALLASKETLLGPFYSNDFVLGFVPKASAPYFFPDNHIVLALFRPGNNEAIVLDPSLGLIDIGATYSGLPYTILSRPKLFDESSKPNEVVELRDFIKDGSGLMSVRREIALGLSPNPQLPVFYTFGIFKNLTQNLTLPFIRVVPPEGDGRVLAVLSQRNRYETADMGLMDKLSPYQKHLLESEMDKFARIYSETPRPERTRKPKPRR